MTSYFARSRGLLHRVSVVLWVAGFWLQTHCSLLAFWLLSWMSTHLDSETVQNPWMCQCTYCKDVYVGLICLRVIYLPKDHDVTLEISGEIYLKYVAFCLSLWQPLRLWTNTGRFLFLPVQYYCSNHSRAEPLSQQGHNLPQYKQQARHSLKSHTHTHTPPAAVFHTSWKLFVLELLLTSAVSLQQSTAEHFIPLTVPIFQTGVFYKTFEVWLETVFSVSGCMKKKQLIFNKLLHIIQSDWNYLTIMLNNNKSVVLFTMSSLFNEICIKTVHYIIATFG